MRPSHKRDFPQLRKLACFGRFRGKVLDGWPSTALARFIQEDCGEALDMESSYLVSLITKYRNSLPPGDLAKPVLPKIMFDKAEELVESLDELDELRKLYEIQIERVKTGHAMEKTIGVIMPQLAVEVRQAREILNTSAQLKMDLGIEDRHLGTMGVDATLTSDLGEAASSEAFKTVMRDAESRRRVLGVAKKFLAAKHAEVEVTSEEVE